MAYSDYRASGNLVKNASGILVATFPGRNRGFSLIAKRFAAKMAPELRFRVPGLSADLASVLSRWRWRLGGLDDVRGGGLGGGGGILASGGQLLLQPVDGGLEDVELGLLGVESRLLSVELRLQPLTVRTRGWGLG